MFQTLQAEINDRFTAVERHFRLSPRKPADLAQTSRGLVFVEIYAIYEYTLRTSTRHSIAEIAACGHSFVNLKPSLQALFLDAELKSLREVSEKKVWEKRIALFEKAISTDGITPVDVMPHDGNYYRHTQLQMTFDVLGINKAITTRKRYKYSIDEVVNNRNRIAHGEETPAEVGRRYSDADIRTRVQTMKRVCTRVVLLMSEHCSSPNLHCN